MSARAMKLDARRELRKETRSALEEPLYTPVGMHCDRVMSKLSQAMLICYMVAG